MVDTFDDAGAGIVLGDAAAQFFGLPVAFGDKDGVGAGQVGRRFAQRAAREQTFGPERLLLVHEHDVLAASAQFPVLKAVVQQEGVAAEFLDGVTAALDAVFVHEHDDVLEIGGEHVGFVTGHFGIQQKRFAIRDHAGRGGVVAEQDFVHQPFVKGSRPGAVTAREDGDVAALVAQFAGEFFDHGGLAGAAKGQITDGDDLHAEGGVAEDADVVEKTARFDREEQPDFGKEGQDGAHDGRAGAAPFFYDYFNKEGFDRFYPDPETFAHFENSLSRRGQKPKLQTPSSLLRQMHFGGQAREKAKTNTSGND